MKLEIVNHKADYAEIIQSLVIKFSFVQRVKPGHYKNLFDFVQCRDFLSDSIVAEALKKKVSIYGFSYNGKKTKAVQNYTILALEFPSEEVKELWKQNWDFYKKELQKKTKVPLGSWFDTGGLHLIVKGPKFWRQSTAALSFYTFIMKGCGYTLDKTLPFLNAVQLTKYECTTWNNKICMKRTTEARYLDNLEETRLNKFISNIKELTSNLKLPHGTVATKEINYYHNYSGFYSVCCNFETEVGARLKAML